jgi:DnaJ-class molecular chaperone
MVHWNVTVLLGCSWSVLQDVIEQYPFVAGSDNEDTIKVVRSGGEDPDGRPGDLYVTLKVSPLRLLQFSSTVDNE